MDIRDVRKLRKEGERLGREGLSKHIIDLCAEFMSAPTHKGAMQLAGRMRVIATAAGYDDYWREQVGKGESAEMFDITKAKPILTEPVNG